MSNIYLCCCENIFLELLDVYQRSQTPARGPHLACRGVRSGQPLQTGVPTLAYRHRHPLAGRTVRRYVEYKGVNGTCLAGVAS